MNQNKNTEWWRWVLLPIAVIALYLLLSFINRIIFQYIETGLYRLAQERVFWKWVYGLSCDGVANLLATIGAIWTGVRIAPNHKPETAIALSMISIVVYILLPIFYAVAISKGALVYEDTIRAFCGCLGNVIGGIGCFFWRNDFE